jgi:hypothetical protein
MIINIQESNRKDKKYLATFKNGRKTHFGQDGSSTYLDHKDKKKRDAYQARAKSILSKTDKYSPSHLSYYLLWGDHTNLRDAVKAYNRRFFK